MARTPGRLTPLVALGKLCRYRNRCQRRGPFRNGGWLRFRFCDPFDRCRHRHCRVVIPFRRRQIVLAHLRSRLVMGGIGGNLYDRLGLWWKPGMPEAWKSGVRDWILFRYQTYTWPNFNIADSCLVIGAFLLASTLSEVKQLNPKMLDPQIEGGDSACIAIRLRAFVAPNIWLDDARTWH